MKKLILPLCCVLLLAGMSCEKESLQPADNAELEALQRIESQVDPMLSEMTSDQHHLLYLSEEREVKAYESYRLEDLEVMEDNQTGYNSQNCNSSSSSQPQTRPFQSDNPREVRRRVARHLNAGHCVLVQRTRRGWMVQRVRCIEP